MRMEKVQEQKERNKLHPVIVRAWGDEPVLTNLHRIDKTMCYVGNLTVKHPVGVLSKDVFVFDPSLFSTLLTAYKTGDFSNLRGIYDSIPVDDFACNRYHNNVDFSHDQESITDPECTAVSDRQRASRR